ncbi:ATP-dependent DNA helicase [Candidatus Parvarchaeota archaeon]|nr:ATP-dependent DNA helicase [Candidatus Parvarchaeota archaeon]
MISFPFKSMRSGQRDIAEAVEKTVKERGKLIIQASTGMGKTAAVLYAAVKAAKENNLKVLFLTAKHTHQNIVYDTMKRINESSSENVSFAGINGKRSMCLFENSVEPSLFIEFCRAVREQNMCDFYSNTFTKSKDVKPAVIEALSGNISDPKSVMETAREFELCPYELSLLNAKQSTVVVANYSHAFDQSIALGFTIRTGIDPGNTILVVDEAHNLPAKILDMNSFSISQRNLEKAYSEANLAGYNDIAVKIDKIIAEIRNVTHESIVDIRGIFSEADLDKMEDIVKFHEKGYNIPAAFMLKNFTEKLLSAKEEDIIYVSIDEKGRRINVNSLDPADYSKGVIDSFYSTILMSGTFRPIEMFSNLLGLENHESLEVKGDAVIDNRLMIIDKEVTSRFSAREEQYSRIADSINDMMEKAKYNMIFFFPSYSFMDRIYSLINEKGRIIKEEQKMERERKNEIMEKLSLSSSVLFAVMNGNFSESIGIKNNMIKLIGIVGVPFEPPSIKLRAMQIYYDKKMGNGFEYAQVLPTMIKVMQAAGRGIRSKNDKCAIVLMDSRYDTPIFKKYLPNDTIAVDSDTISVIREKGFA